MPERSVNLRALRAANYKRAGLLCLAGLFINVYGVYFARVTGAPLYIDNIGSALAAALGGLIPGIVVGFLTNLLNAIGDYTTAYYGSLTVLIAVCSAWFAQRGFYDFKKPWRLLAVVAVFALIGGGLGSVLTWTLYGFSFGEGVSAPLAHRLYESGRLSQFASQFMADMLIDLADKSITVVVVAAVWNLTPEALRKRLYFTGWRQTPLTDETLAGATRTPVRRMSLRAKITLLVGSAMIIVAAVITAISFDQYRDALIEGVKDGTVDMIVTDHAPHAAEEKSRGLAGSPMGIVGLETSFPLLYTYLVLPGVITLPKLLDLTAYAPRRRFGLPVRDDDFTLFDLGTSERIDPADFLSKGKSTPFEGWKVRAKCVLTVSCGRIAYLDAKARTE